MLVPLAGLEPATCCSGDGSPQTLCSAANLLVGGDREAEVILSPLTGLLTNLRRARRTLAAPIGSVMVMAARQRRGVLGWCHSGTAAAGTATATG
jgi:hypothetical protein